MSSNIVRIQMLPNTRIRVVEAITVHPDEFSGHHEFGFDKDELIAAIQNTMAPDPEPHRMESFMYLGAGMEVAS